MYEAAPARQKAFFDSSEAPDTSFWHQAKPKFFDGYHKLLEHAFYIRRNEISSHWLNCTLTLYGSYIACKMVQSEYIRSK